MQRTDLPLPLRNLLGRIPYATIATVGTDGRPWNTPVVSFFDEQLRLYWASGFESQHSRNIAADPRIFVVVYDSLTPLGSGEGLYLQMRAAPITDETEVERAMQIYADRYGETECPVPFRGKCPRRIYRAVPEQIWRNCDAQPGGHFVDGRADLQR